jgi:hypothetical protein
LIGVILISIQMIIGIYMGEKSEFKGLNGNILAFKE